MIAVVCESPRRFKEYRHYMSSCGVFHDDFKRQFRRVCSLDDIRGIRFTGFIRLRGYDQQIFNVLKYANNL